MEYPLDSKTVDDYLGHIVGHERKQRQVQKDLIELLIEAMGTVPVADRRETPWYIKADRYLVKQKRLQVEHENRIFNEDNYKKANGLFNNIRVSPEVAKENYADVVPTLGLNIGEIDAPEVTEKLNQKEAEFGEEMSEADAAKHFGVQVPKKVEQKPFSEMSLDEINSWEAKQNNSNDIYKVKARVANLARANGASLTPVGEMMVNTFVHVVKDLYDFADTIPDMQIRIKLIERIRKHEGMPGNLINAAGAGVRQKKEEKIETDDNQQ